MKRHRAKPIGNVLQSVLKDINAYDDFIKLWILQNWNEVMVEPISRICRPVKFEDNVLIVEAISESWANELQKYKKDMIDILNRKFDQLHVTGIKIE